MGKLRAHQIVVLTVILLAMAVSGCGSNDGSKSEKTDTTRSESSNTNLQLPQGSEPVNLDPADFTTHIDNRYWPMTPGSKWVYSETENGGKQRVEVTVTNDTKLVDQITARVVHDVVTANGKIVEDTYDWYAQDSSGNIWYLGEDTREYKHDRVVSTEGSWQAGVDGAMAGVVMPAKPKVGMSYRQEYYAGEAEDAARVLSVDEIVEVPFGSFRNAVMTKDYTPLDPEILEHKFYARNVGPVLAIAISGGSGREELISFRN